MSLAKYFRGNNDVVLCFSLDLACYLYILRVLNIFKGEVICRFINNPDNEIGTSLINKIKKKISFLCVKKMRSCYLPIRCYEGSFDKQI